MESVPVALCGFTANRRRRTDPERLGALGREGERAHDRDRAPDDPRQPRDSGQT